MRPVIADLRARGHDVAGHRARLRPDAGPVRPLRDRAHRDRRATAAATCSTRPEGSASARWSCTRWAEGRGLSTSRSATGPTTSPSRRRCCGSRRRRCSTTSGRPSSTTSTAGWRAASWFPMRSPAERLASLRRRRQDPRLRGPQGGVLPGGLRARPGGALELGLDASQPIARRAHRRRRCRSITASRTTCSRRCSTGCAAPRRSCWRARPSSATQLAAGRGLHRSRARDRRAVADRLLRSGGVRGRDDEPRGGRAGDARADGVRGSPGCCRRATDRPGPARSAAQRRPAGAGQAGHRRRCESRPRAA